MHLTSSLIVTGVVIYASQGVGSGESGPLPENFSGSSLDVMLHLRPKLEGVWTRGTSKKIGTPYLFLQPLKLATSNLVCNFGLGLAYQKQRLGPKLAGAWAREASEKNWDPYLFLQPTEKLVHNRFTLPNTSFRTKPGSV